MCFLGPGQEEQSTKANKQKIGDASLVLLFGPVRKKPWTLSDLIQHPTHNTHRAHVKVRRVALQ